MNDREGVHLALFQPAKPNPAVTSANHRHASFVEQKERAGIGFVEPFRPRVTVTAISGNSDEMLDPLISHYIQFALIEEPALRKDIHVEPFMEDPLVLVVPASHEWAGHEINV